MANFNEPVVLGRTGLKVGRLGISSSYGAPAAAFEEAFERGCNYLTWGTFIKGDAPEMKKAIKNLVKKGKREEMVIAAFSYAHQPWLTSYFLKQKLRKLQIEYIDVLLLGYFPKIPSPRILEGARKLKDRGLIKHIGISGHNRDMFPKLIDIPDIDVCHVRYNAAHRGAEKEVFPYFDQDDRPGIVSFTATRWGQLMQPKKMPEGKESLTAAQCYRYVLSNPSVDVCMMATKNIEQMRQNLTLLNEGSLNPEEKHHIEEIGKFVYAHK